MLHKINASYLDGSMLSGHYFKFVEVYVNASVLLSLMMLSAVATQGDYTETSA